MEPTDIRSKVDWVVSKQEGDTILVTYMYLDSEYKARITVPGISKGISLDLVQDMISSALRLEVRKHRLVNLKGTFIFHINEKESKSMADMKKISKDSLVVTLVDATTEAINSKKAELTAEGYIVTDIRTNPCTVKNGDNWVDTIATHFIYRKVES